VRYQNKFKPTCDLFYQQSRIIQLNQKIEFIILLKIYRHKVACIKRRPCKEINAKKKKKGEEITNEIKIKVHEKLSGCFLSLPPLQSSLGHAHYLV
jgi:hypothetical protein